jgi:IclR family transcriptional regulator, acetate operon repressor
VSRRGPSEIDDGGASSATSVQSVERAVALLRLFLPNVASLGPTDIAQRSGMSVSTAHRYCAALRKAGLLRYDEATGRYGLGGGCIELGRAATEAIPVVDLARPLMGEIVDQVDRTAVLGVWDEHAVRVVEVNDHTTSAARVTVRVGSQLPVFDTAQGLVFLAFSDRVRQRFARRPELDQVRTILDGIVRDGCAIVRSVAGPNSVPGTTAAAVPVFAGGHVAAALAIIGSTESMPGSADSRVVDYLRQTGEQLSRRLSA